jgi:PBP1b-binding outer membrane lipoprotein LpoB
MKKLSSILYLLLISIFILSGCAPEQTQDYTQNKQQAVIFVQSSEEFKKHPGFDFLEKDPSVKMCGSNCFEFNFQYSALGAIIGYKTDVIVKDGIPEFTNKPTPLN